MEGDLAQRCADLARARLKLAGAELRDAHYYASVPLCLIDAVFSIGVRYSSTARAVQRFAAHQDPKWPIFDRRRMTNEAVAEKTVACLVAALEGRPPADTAETIFKNHQRTSPRNGILKSQAVLEFAKALSRSGIEVFEDLTDDRKVATAREQVLQVKGQSSGISFDYFLLLAGSDNHVKADRMVRRFVSRAKYGHDVAPNELSIPPKLAFNVVVTAAHLLKGEFPNMTPRLLDSLIWAHERVQR